jgi:hypothetical protein
MAQIVWINSKYFAACGIWFHERGGVRRINRNRTEHSNHSAATVVQLDLETGLYSGLQLEEWADYEKVKPAFSKIVGSKFFPRLKSIVLRDWLFMLEELEVFLLAHANTLRELHLINCCIAEASESEFIDSIKSKLQPALSLTGVEIYALAHEDFCRKLYAGESIHDENDPADQVELCSEFEAMFLGGRPNLVTRLNVFTDAQSCADWMVDGVADQMELPARRRNSFDESDGSDDETSTLEENDDESEADFDNEATQGVPMSLSGDDAWNTEGEDSESSENSVLNEGELY